MSNKDFNADVNNSNGGTSGFNKDYLARTSNNGKTNNPTWIKSQQKKGRIPRKK